MSVALGTGIIYPALRIAGVTDRPGRTPSTDQAADCIGIVNRMLDNWDIKPLAIYSTVIASYPLTAAKTYTIGPGGAFDTARPNRIRAANIIVPGTPASRYELVLLDDIAWSEIEQQDLAGTIPDALYNDRAHPLSTLYLYGQPVAGYSLELYTWDQIPAFTAVSDTVTLPPGYELAITYNLARLIASQFPSQSHMSEDSLAIAKESLSDVLSLNAPAPVLTCDSSMLGSGGGGNWNILTGRYR